MSSLGERIRARRKELGLTQSQLGGPDLTKGFISLVEKGRAKPSIETLVLLARRLQRPVGYFLEERTPLDRKDLDVLVRSAWVALKRGEFTNAADAFTQALGIAQHQHDGASEAECAIGLGSALACLRQFDLARENLTHGQTLADTIRDPYLMARVIHAQGLLEYYERNLPAARAHFADAYRRLQECGSPDRSLAGGLLLNLGDTHRESGDYAEAWRWYGEALEMLAPTQDLQRIGAAHVQLGAAQRDGGNYDAALAHLSRAEHIFELLEDTRLLAQARTSIGLMLLERGEASDALTHLRASLRIKEQLADDPGRARALTEVARALIAAGQPAEAERALGDAERLAQKVQDVVERARIQLVRARLLRGQGRAADAVRHYTQAIEVFEAQEMRADLASACNELGELLIEQHRPSEAAPYLARALQAMRTEKNPGPASPSRS